MDYRILNAALLIGWVMFLVGGVKLNFGWGLVAGGALLIALTLAEVLMFGVRGPQAKNGEGA